MNKRLGKKKHGDELTWVDEEIVELGPVRPICKIVSFRATSAEVRKSKKEREERNKQREQHKKQVTCSAPGQLDIVFLQQVDQTSRHIEDSVQNGNQHYFPIYLSLSFSRK